MTGSKDEATSLVRFLDFQRDTVIGKIEGLDREAAARSPVPSGTSLLGLVKHLTHVERFWFQAVFTGRDVAFPWTDEDPDADWRPGEEETVDQAVSGYRGAIAASQEAIAGASLDDVGRYRDREFTLRWIMLHMIEETARHAGHADIIREQVDGTTGF
jgi:uncharacterized damage-inducible protein DinB